MGTTINIFIAKTCEIIGITALKPTSTLLELAHRSVVKREGTLQDIMVSVNSWNYMVYFLVINPKRRLDKYPLILGRPWLATPNA